ncbi:hypothetical protein [Lactococcus protaetiae]|uniref:Uncharacterized protein n=1 Tax=Lactococcus protaetiae TaxID=2592653 RepID=A0A514Z6C7_9LACT|nr:hypothetical protein [Lactococcus protaetiae]QDK70144.1 hypothetical protein FLP15_01825 [Lactococcus protaetiae]
MRTMLNPNETKKKQEQAAKRKARFEQRFEKQRKKAEAFKNKQASETKQQRANEKVAPYNDMKQENPRTDKGKTLKELKQQADQKVEQEKKMAQIRPAAERFAKNTQAVYEKSHQSSETKENKLVKSAKIKGEQQQAAYKMAHRFESQMPRFLSTQQSSKTNNPFIVPK